MDSPLSVLKNASSERQYASLIFLQHHQLKCCWLCNVAIANQLCAVITTDTGTCRKMFPHESIIICILCTMYVCIWSINSSSSSSLWENTPSTTIHGPYFCMPGNVCILTYLVRRWWVLLTCPPNQVKSVPTILNSSVCVCLSIHKSPHSHFGACLGCPVTPSTEPWATFGFLEMGAYKVKC